MTLLAIYVLISTIPGLFQWAFIDANTETANPALGITNALPKPLKTGLEITKDTNIAGDSPFHIEAVLVGNLTNPTADPF